MHGAVLLKLADPLFCFVFCLDYCLNSGLTDLDLVSPNLYVFSCVF